MFQACLSLSFTNMVFPSWSLTHPVRLIDLPFSAALVSFFSALSTFLSPAVWSLLAGSCAIKLNEAVMTNANNNVSKRFIGSPPSVNAFYSSSDAGTPPKEGWHNFKNKQLRPTPVERKCCVQAFIFCANFCSNFFTLGDTTNWQ